MIRFATGSNCENGRLFATSVITGNPDDTTFSKTRPIGTFDSFDVDCFFWLNEDCGVFNSPPQGWDRTASYPVIP